MKIMLILILTTFGICSYAAQNRPSEELLKELLEVMDSKNLILAVISQTQQMMDAQFKNMEQNQNITKEEKALTEKFKEKIVGVLKDELDWDKVRPLFMRIYDEAFSKEEVEGLIAFYKTPSGRALVKKMPIVTQRTMIEMQNVMEPVKQKLGIIQQEFALEVSKAKLNK